MPSTAESALLIVTHLTLTETLQSKLIIIPILEIRKRDTEFRWLAHCTQSVWTKPLLTHTLDLLWKEPRPLAKLAGSSCCAPGTSHVPVDASRLAQWGEEALVESVHFCGPDVPDHGIGKKCAQWWVSSSSPPDTAVTDLWLLSGVGHHGKCQQGAGQWLWKNRKGKSVS